MPWQLRCATCEKAVDPATCAKCGKCSELVHPTAACRRLRDEAVWCKTCYSAQPWPPRGRKDGATAGTAKGASSSATAGSAAASGGQLLCPFERVGCPFTCSQPQKLIEHTNEHKDAYDSDL